jgi:hypothetical protein
MSAITSARSSRESSACLRSRAASRAASNLGKEITAQRNAEGVLRPLERCQYLDGGKTALRVWTRPASSWRGW